jgi:YVTN family beta-propeller protein
MALAPASFFQNATRCSWRFHIEAHNKQKSVVINSNETSISWAQQKQTDDSKRDPDDSLPGLRFAKKQNRSHSHDPHPAGEGLRGIASRFGALGLSDHEILDHEFIVYDALYAECKRQTDTVLLTSFSMKNLCLFLLISWAASTGCFGKDAYQSSSEIPIGGEGGWDILTIDPKANRLYLSHSTKVVVVDLRKNAVAGEIADTPGVHAFVAVPEFQRGFSSNGKESKSSVVDLTTLKTNSKIDTGSNPDAIVYEPRHGEVYVFNHTGNSVTVINAKTGTVSATIPLGGTPEFAAVDEEAGRIYCNIEDKSEVAVIDAEKHEVVAHWPLGPGEGPSGIALDAQHHRLFSGCHNKMMTMLDTESGKVIATVPIGAGVDGCAFDDSMQFAFASCGDGTTTIAKEEVPNKLSVVQVLKTERGARTMALDPRTHRIYLPTAQFAPAPSPSPGASPARPSIVPNTLKLLVYGPAERVKR